MGCMECMEWWTEVMMGDISRVVTSPNIYVADHGSLVLLEKILQTLHTPTSIYCHINCLLCKIPFDVLYITGR